MMTREEQERLAYINGDTDKATLLNTIVVKNLLIEELERRIKELETENDSLIIAYTRR